VRPVSAPAMNRAVTDVVATAASHAHRADPTPPRTGGPAGYAQLTAGIGLGLLIVFLAELVTLLDVTGLISWHIAIGVLLASVVVAIVAAVVILHLSGAWTGGDLHRFHHRPGATDTQQ